MQPQSFEEMLASGGADPAAALDRVATTAHDTVDRVHRRASELTSDSDRLYQAACGWITAHPMKAVAGALVAGYLLGRMRG